LHRFGAITLPSLDIRRARPDDASTVVALVRELAIYEREPPTIVKLTEDDVRRDCFGTPPRFEVLLGSVDGSVEGIALFFHNYSTWEGRSGLYLEDLFVRDTARGFGLGQALMVALARIARDRGCRRLGLMVLDWNPTRSFYERLGFQQQKAWLPYRLDEAGILRLAEA
jgi:GNAT superfamily N-acetyltransferase